MATMIERQANAIARTTATRTSRKTRMAQVAGLLLAIAGVVILMGIITAEAEYPAVYTTHENEISDLGATRPPDSIIRQPSARIFNGVMMASGAMILAAGALLHRPLRSRRITVPMMLLGAGVLGVGVFPGNYGSIHPWFALMAFVAGGLAAVLSAHVQPAPLRYFSVALGVLSLGSLVVGMFGESSWPYKELGDGGLERWIAYPVVLWMVAFGAFLAGRDAPTPAAA